MEQGVAERLPDMFAREGSHDHDPDAAKERQDELSDS
jgi:hypothetical protein